MSHSAGSTTDYDTLRADRVFASAFDSVLRLLARLLVEQRYRIASERRPARYRLATWLAPGALTLVSLFSIGLIAAPAEPYPARPIRLIVPFAAGGPNDISARLVADALGTVLRQPIVIENRPGAAGNLGAEAAARAAPDGHVLFWAQAATHGINPSLYRHLGYDAIRDFAPVGLIVSEPLVLVTSAASRWRDLKDVIADAKADPAAIQFGSGGRGTTPHMAGELFATMAGIRLTHVSYRGNAPAVSDVLAGRIHLVFDGINTALGHVQAGTLRALAVTGRERAAALPDVPAVADTIPGYDVRSWGGIVAPAQTPEQIIQRLSLALATIAADPALQRRFAELGAHFEVSTPEAMGAFIRGEIARWRILVEQTAMELQ
jgi:tripartite-type tricarboxylate transporter receptor subunit TctC